MFLDNHVNIMYFFLLKHVNVREDAVNSKDKTNRDHVNNM